MSIEEDILTLASEIEALLPRFQKSPNGHEFLTTEDQSKFKRLTLEAKSAIDAALGALNDFSLNLYSATVGTGSYLYGPSVAKVSDTAETIRGAVNQYRRRQVSGSSGLANTQPKPPYVDLSRIAALRSLKTTQWDYSRLVQMCVEINAAHEAKSYISIAMLVRSIVDHVPPIFGQANFAGVANNYAGAKSFKNSGQHLDQSLRNIADGQLHSKSDNRKAYPVQRRSILERTLMFCWQK